MTVAAGINKTTDWFVPLSDLDNPDGARLRRTNAQPSDADPFEESLAQPGDAFTVTLESFCITKNYDTASGDNNDLLVRSRIRYGSEPRIETINFFGLDVPPGTVEDDLEFEYVFALDDYAPEKRLYLEVEIMEIDKNIDRDQSLLPELRGIANGFGGLFTRLIPFGNVAVGVLDRLDKLTALRDQNKQIFSNKVDLYSQGGEGEGRLRYGAYVFFNTPVEAVQYRLRELKLEYFTPSERGKPVRDDYVVIKIVQGIVDTGQVDSQERAQNQQLAAVLSQMDDDERKNQAARQEHFRYLQRIVANAQKMNDLDQLRKLQSQKKVLGELSASQTQKLLALAERLRDYV